MCLRKNIDFDYLESTGQNYTFIFFLQLDPQHMSRAMSPHRNKYRLQLFNPGQISSNRRPTASFRIKDALLYSPPAYWSLFRSKPNGILGSSPNPYLFSIGHKCSSSSRRSFTNRSNTCWIVPGSSSGGFRSKTLNTRSLSQTQGRVGEGGTSGNCERSPSKVPESPSTCDGISNLSSAATLILPTITISRYLSFPNPSTSSNEAKVAP